MFPPIREKGYPFLSIQAQDFIEDQRLLSPLDDIPIPEHSSSGLH